jgi:hypothetical protein
VGLFSLSILQLDPPGPLQGTGPTPPSLLLFSSRQLTIFFVTGIPALVLVSCPWKPNNKAVEPKMSAHSWVTGLQASSSSISIVPCCCQQLPYPTFQPPIFSYFFLVSFPPLFYLSIYLSHIFICDMCVHAHVYAIAHVCRSEDSLQELVLSFYHVGPGGGGAGQVLAVRLGSWCPYPLSHTANPTLSSKGTLFLANRVLGCLQTLSLKVTLLFISG